MTTFAMRGNTSRQVHAAHSRTRLGLRGQFHMVGRQPVGEAGGAPDWVADVLDAHPEIQQLIVNYHGSGICYMRVPQDAATEVKDT